MKSLIIFLVILVVGVDCLKAQSVIFFDDFGSASFPNGYSIYDVDSNTVNSTVSDIFDEAWVQLSFYEDDNAFIGSTSWYDPTGTSNDWLVSPPINLTTENYLVFKTISVDSTVHDGYELKLSTTTNEVDSFKTTLMEVNSENSFWTTHVVDLSDYATDTIYLAWINNTNNGYVLGLDDVKVVEVNAFDVAIEKVLLEDKVEQNSEINVVIRNKGMQLDSVKLNWSVDSGPIHSQLIEGLNLGFYDTALVSHSVLFHSDNLGTFSNLKVWVSSPNGQIDIDNQNDTISKTVFTILGKGVKRNVLFEEFTTADCQYCTDGHVVLDQILSEKANVIPVSIHACYGIDSMTNQYALDLCNTLGNIAPSGMIDRYHYDGDIKPSHGRNFWANRVNQRSSVLSTADIKLTGVFNVLTQGVVLNVEVNFVDYDFPGDIRLSLMLVEDSVSGIGKGWDHINAYNYLLGHPMHGRGNPIIGYQHRHVLREILPSTWGDSTVFPNNVEPNNIYKRAFHFTLNNSYKTKDVSFVAVVSYVGTNTVDFEVINAEKISLNDLKTTSMVESIATKASVNIYPNPSQDITTVELKSIKNLAIKITVFDITGKAVINKNYGEMVKGNHKLPINVSTLSNGFYIMKVQVGEEVLSQKISVNR